MAKIKKSASAPSDALTVSFPSASFELSSGSYETDDPQVISEAVAHPWFEVEQDAVVDEGPDTYDENDPQDNPNIDPFTRVASDKVKEEAESHNKEIQAEYENAEDVARFGSATDETEDKPAPPAAPSPQPTVTRPSTGDNE